MGRILELRPAKSSMDEQQCMREDELTVPEAERFAAGRREGEWRGGEQGVVRLEAKYDNC